MQWLDMQRLDMQSALLSGRNALTVQHALKRSDYCWQFARAQCGLTKTQSKMVRLACSYSSASLDRRIGGARIPFKGANRV